MPPTCSEAAGLVVESITRADAVEIIIRIHSFLLFVRSVVVKCLWCSRQLGFDLYLVCCLAHFARKLIFAACSGGLIKLPLASSGRRVECRRVVPVPPEAATNDLSMAYSVTGAESGFAGNLMTDQSPGGPMAELC